MKISVKLTLLFLLISIIPISILSYFSINASREALRDSIGMRVQNLAEEKANTMALIIKERIAETKHLSGTSEVKRAVGESNLPYIDKTDDEIQKSIKEIDELWISTKGKSKMVDEILKSNISKFLKEYQKKDPVKYGEIFITDVKGVTVGMTKILSDYYQADESWWIKAYDNGRGKIFIDYRGYDASIKALTLGIVVPVYDNEKVIGILKINYKVVSILDVVASSDILKDGLETFLAGSHKGMIAHTPGRFDEKLTDTEINLLTQNKTGWAEDYHGGKKFIMGYSPVSAEIFTRVQNPGEIKGVSGEKWESTTWYLFIDFDEEKAFVPINILTRHLYFAGFFLIIAVLILASFAVRSISDPIKKLIYGAEIIGSGNLGHKIGIKKKDEIGRLSNAFDQMTENLKKTTASRDDLQKEVATRKKAESAVKTERDKLVGILNAMEDGVYIVNRDCDIEYINPAMEKEFGPVKGRKCYEFFHNRTEVCPWCKNEEVFAGKSVQWEWYSSKNKKHYELFDTPIKNTDGSISKFEILHDITNRKEAEEELRKEEEKVRLLLDSTVEGIYGVDINGNCTFANRSCLDILGYKDESQLMGNNMHDLIHHTRADGTPYPVEECRIFQAFREGKEMNVEDEVFWRPDGNHFPVEYWSHPIWKDEKAIGSVVTFVNITERKRAEEELKKHREHLEELVKERTKELAAVNKELEAFSYSVSHDLRTPLRSLDGFSKILLRDYNDKLDERGKDFLNRITNASQRMARIIDELLKLSRLTRSELTCEPVDLSELAYSIADELKNAEPERRVEFLIKGGVVAKGDKLLLRQALVNLIGNAWKYTEKSPHAKIEFGVTECDGERAYFVRDNGAGFDMAYANKLFGAFQRLHSEDEFKGIGIGLAIVKRIINRHGGRVWGEGKVNEGATFYFKL